jgi:peptidoglycan/LPS O-acetylase OafA/YrhL
MRRRRCLKMQLDEVSKVHRNSFGALRLLFAYAVIVSHSPQLIDGNFSREIFISHGLQVSLGELAVAGFFIISGYLIAGSYLSDPNLWRFLERRILRIYPAFIVASLICIFLVGPLSGGALGAMSAHDWLLALGRLVFLVPPVVPMAFHGLPIPALDGSMWTIRYEFRCYLLVAAIGALGLLRKPRLILLLTATVYGVALAVDVVRPAISRGTLHQMVFTAIGDPDIAFKLTAVFLSGACIRLFRDRISFPPLLVALSAIGWGAALMTSFLVYPATGVFGAYIIFWAALCSKSAAIEAINNRYDYSYGTYLYAWPIASIIVLMFKHDRLLTQGALTFITLILATSAGAVSWYFVEKPTLNLKPRRSLTRPDAAVTTSACA